MNIKNIKYLLVNALLIVIFCVPLICIAKDGNLPTDLPKRGDIIEETERKNNKDLLDNTPSTTTTIDTPNTSTNTSTCNGIKLNTNFPGIGKCIPYEQDGPNPTNVFQKTMRTLTKLTMSIILVVCFIMIIIAGIMRAGAGEDSSQRTKAKKLIERVAITILLLGFSGVILRLINPNFFG